MDIMNVVAEAQETIERMEEAKTAMLEAIEDEACAKADVRDAEDRIKDVETEIKGEEAVVIFDLERAALDKKGPLAGLAKTSAGYKAGIEAAINEASESGPLKVLNNERNGLQVKMRNTLGIQLRDAEVAKAQAAARMSAVKHTANLQVAILNALSA